jgi:acetyl esterase/lipase
VKKIAAVAAVGIAALATRRHLAMGGDMAAVAPELRKPYLTLFASAQSTRTLPLIRLLFRMPLPSGGGVTVSERRVGEPPVRVLVTAPVDRHALAPAVLWIHFGGMVLGSPQMELPFSGHLARELAAVVVSPDYRLAPEHPFPAALDDCMTTLLWMRANADELGIDRDRIAVAGASAGGGLSAALAQRSHDEGIPLRAQVLVYPMLDDRTTLGEDHAVRGQFLWTPAASRFGWSAYLGGTPRMADAPEYAAPARRTDLTGLAPAWIGVGDLDLLHDESVDYAERLAVAGVQCELVTIPGMYHGADGIAPKAPSMQNFRASMIAHLRAHLAAEPA